MSISKDYIKNTILIGVSFVLLKSFNLVLPYSLDDVSYNEFNKVFYYASLISTIGTFGFTYAITQIDFSPIILSLLVILNIIISYFIVYTFSGVEVSLFNLANIFLISFSSILFSVYNFRLLFLSKTNKFFITVVIISTSYFLALAINFLTGTNLLFLYGLLGTVGLFFSFYFFDLGTTNKISDIKKLYKIGFSTFIINSAAGMVLMADKFFANNIFSIEIANAYTFAWALVAPIFYLGNIVEKNIYAAGSKQSIKDALFNSFGMIIIGLISYGVIVYFISNYYPNLLPSSINISLFSDIFLYMLLGYSLFILLHFPINGILFKLNFHDSQKMTSYVYLVILGISALLYYFNIISFDTSNYIKLLGVVVTILMILSSSKFFLLFYLHKRAIIGLFKKS